MNNIKTRIGVISMAPLAMAGSVTGAAIAAIAKDFPDTRFRQSNFYQHFLV